MRYTEITKNDKELSIKQPKVFSPANHSLEATWDAERFASKVV